MVLAGHGGERRDLFIFGTPYCEFLPVVQKSAPGSFYPHTYAGLCHMDLLPGVSEWHGNARQIKVQKTRIQSQQFDEIRIVQKLVTELAGISVTPWACIVLMPVLNLCFWCRLPGLWIFVIFPFPSQIRGLYHDYATIASCHILTNSPVTLKIYALPSPILAASLTTTTKTWWDLRLFPDATVKIIVLCDAM
jgi:hypothetical protein